MERVKELDKAVLEQAAGGAGSISRLRDIETGKLDGVFRSAIAKYKREYGGKLADSYIAKLVKQDLIRRWSQSCSAQLIDQYVDKWYDAVK